MDFVNFMDRFTVFRHQNRISGAEIQRRTGIATSHLASLENGKTDLSFRFLVRLVDAFRFDGIEEALFDEETVGVSWFQKFPIKINTFSDIDSCILPFLLNQEFVHWAEADNALYYAFLVLADTVCLSDFPGTDKNINYVSITETERRYPRRTPPLLSETVSVLMNTISSSSLSRSMEISIETKYPKDASGVIAKILLSGGCITFTDVASLIGEYRKENKLKIHELDSLSGCSSGFSYRLEQQTIDNAKVEDVQKLDSVMHMDGLFLAAYYMAMQSLLLMECICGGMAEIDKFLCNKEMKPFIRLLRSLEFSKKGGSLFPTFLTDYRSIILSDSTRTDLFVAKITEKKNYIHNFDSIQFFTNNGKQQEAE